MPNPPLIGLTSYRFINDNGQSQLAINENYTWAIQDAGGLPVVIPLGLPEDVLDGLLARLNGIVFTGGGDIHPQRYGSLPHLMVDGVDHDRDRVELYLAERLLNSSLPVLGICRGLQVLNIALGGTLYEDILDQHPGAKAHQFYPGWPRNHLAHTVQVQPDSRTAQALGISGTVPVNSLHHQGIASLATTVKPTAVSPDGIIEAFERTDHPFFIAVQWHPEWLQEHESMRRLFQQFIQTATSRDGSVVSH